MFSLQASFFEAWSPEPQRELGLRRIVVARQDNQDVMECSSGYHAVAKMLLSAVGCKSKLYRVSIGRLIERGFCTFRRRLRVEIEAVTLQATPSR